VRVVEASGKDVEEAVRKGLDELGVEREKVEIHVLDDGSGVGEAKVRLSAAGGEVVTEAEAQARLPEDERGPAAQEN
jgi:predicted RNA-binding protein Jag